MEVERAVGLSPGSVPGYLALAIVMNATARPAEALMVADKAMRLDPHSDGYLLQQGWACNQLGRWEEAISTLKRFSVRHEDNLFSHLLLAEGYIEVGREEAARGEVAEVLRINPLFSLKTITPTGAIFTTTPGGKRFEADLRKAGLK
jgi:predicted Zn-dependent protease